MDGIERWECPWCGDDIAPDVDGACGCGRIWVTRGQLNIWGGNLEKKRAKQG
jgi:hypothetical protein